MSRISKRSYKSKFYGVLVREEIVKDFTRPDGTVDDFMAGLHEIRYQMGEKLYKAMSLSSIKDIKDAKHPFV